MNRIGYLLAVVLMAALVVLNVFSVRHKTLTYDEPWHFRYGLNVVDGDPERFVDGTMPFSALNVIPRKVGELSSLKERRSLLTRVEAGRYVTIVFSLVTAFFVFKWSRDLYGIVPGLFSLALYTFCPNIIAHSRLITTDMYAAGMVLFSLFSFSRFLSRGGWKLAGASAVLLGLSQLAKYVCLLLYPIFFIIVAAKYARSLAVCPEERRPAKVGRSVTAFFKYALFFAAVSIIVINIGFLFDRSFVPLREYEMRSEVFKGVQSNLSVFGNVPVPVPYPYLEGIDWGQYRVETGKGFGSTYLFGQLREIGGFKGYYFFAYLFKVPLATQVLILIAIVAYVVNRKRYRFFRDELPLLGPIVFFAVYFNFFFKLQIGIRHLLVAFPLVHVFSGSLFTRWDTWSLKVKSGVILLVLYLLISVLSYFPHYIPYFNELVWDRKQAYKILADSNVEWGQDKEYVRRFKQEHPDAYVEEGLWHMPKYRDKHMDEYLNPQFPDSGLIVVGVNNFVGIYHPHRYEWLREKYEPVDHIAYSYLVFDISPRDSSEEGR